MKNLHNSAIEVGFRSRRHGPTAGWKHNVVSKMASSWFC